MWRFCPVLDVGSARTDGISHDWLKFWIRREQKITKLIALCLMNEGIDIESVHTFSTGRHGSSALAPVWNKRVGNMINRCAWYHDIACDTRAACLYLYSHVWNPFFHGLLPPGSRRSQQKMIRFLCKRCNLFEPFWSLKLLRWHLK